MRIPPGTHRRAPIASTSNALFRVGNFVLPVPWFDLVLRLNLSRPCSAIKAISGLDSDLLERLSRRKALYQFKRAWTSVPAYRKFLCGRGIDPLTIRTFADFQARVPRTTKKDYILPFSLPERCVGGVLPLGGTLDESAGTSSDPTNWIRTPAEDRAHFPMTKTTMAYLFGMTGKRPVVFLNGFLPGAWAGSQRFAGSMGPLGLVKNAGVDAAKIIRTMIMLGPDNHYLIGGYPPFLKELADKGASWPNFAWTRYHIGILAGGEGFVEEWRDYMSTRLGDRARIFSDYGAIDTDAGISLETFFAVGIKRLARGNDALRKSLFGGNRLPCFLGQYSPAHFLIQNSGGGNAGPGFDVTVLNVKTSLPRIRYDVGDEGGTISFSRMAEILEAHGYPLSEFASPADGRPLIPFPFLYIFGRGDGTVFFHGATIVPSDIDAAILATADLAAKIRTFKVSVEPDSGQEARLMITMELAAGVPETDLPAERCRDVLLAHFIERNPCYRQAFEKAPDQVKPVIRLVRFGEAPFGGGPVAPKFRYFMEDRAD